MHVNNKIVRIKDIVVNPIGAVSVEKNNIYRIYNISFFDINKDFPVEKVLSLYNTLHEADITKFYDIADEFINNNKKNKYPYRMKIT